MGKTDKLDDSIYYKKVPGSGGIISTIFFAIFGTAIIAVSLIFATDFICDFAGIDFDVILWLREFVDYVPQPMTDLLHGFLDLVAGFMD